MSKRLFTAAVFICVGALAVIGCNADANTTANDEGLQVTASIENKDSLVGRGKYLVSIMDCDACHSPKIRGSFGPEPDPDRLLSGHPASMPFPAFDTADLQSFVLFNQMSTAAAGPWGVSFAANLTSDETGIGNWTEEQFFRALRKGKFKGMENGRNIQPPMPWPTYSANLKDEDIKAIFAYLKSTKPVSNVVPAAIAGH